MRTRRGVGPGLLAGILLAGCITAEPRPLPSTAPARPAGPAASAPSGPPAASMPRDTSAAPPSQAALDPATARWSQVAGPDTAPAGVSLDLVGFDAGYVVLATGEPFERPIAWFSADGRSWASTSLANVVPNCPGWGPDGEENVPDAEARAIATNGRHVLIVGEDRPHDAAFCGGAGIGAIKPVAWVSGDGLTWQRSVPMDAGADGDRATSVSTVTDGWLAVGDRLAWHSPDGLRWAAVGMPGPLLASAGHATDGSRLVAAVVGGEGWSEVRLFRSADGRAWTPIDDGAGCEVGATQIVAPRPGGDPRWVVIGDGRTCTSIDLIEWVATPLPIVPWRIAATRFGPIAVGDTCVGAGNSCPDSETQAYVLTGLGAWSRIAYPDAPIGRAIADGPAGVLLIGSRPGSDDDRVVWLLEP